MAVGDLDERRRPRPGDERRRQPASGSISERRLRRAGRRWLQLRVTRRRNADAIGATSRLGSRPTADEQARYVLRSYELPREQRPAGTLRTGRQTTAVESASRSHWVDGAAGARSTRSTRIDRVEVSCGVATANGRMRGQIRTSALNDDKLTRSAERRPSRPNPGPILGHGRSSPRSWRRGAAGRLCRPARPTPAVDREAVKSRAAALMGQFRYGDAVGKVCASSTAAAKGATADSHRDRPRDRVAQPPCRTTTSFESADAAGRR